MQSGYKATYTIDPLVVKLVQELERNDLGLENKINKCIRLARFLKNKLVWAILAVFCLENRDTNSAEICLGALENVEKVKFIFKINNTEDE